MRIAVICNDRLGFPALQHLLQQQLVVAVGTSNRVSETKLLLEKKSSDSKIPIQIFDKNNLETTLLEWLKCYKTDVVLVLTFPWKIPVSLLTIPKFGFINFHYAPLPAFRGTNPLFWMIRNREPVGGLTIHQMDENFDTGKILLTKEVPIYPEYSFGMLVAQLAYTGLDLVMPLLQALEYGTLKPKQQDNSQSKWYGQPKPKDFFIDWNIMTSWEVRALIKACNPWQKGAATQYKGWTFRITDASLSFVAIPSGTISGTIISIDESNGLLIACADGKALKAEVIYTEEGYFSGNKMLQFGLRKGERLA